MKVLINFLLFFFFATSTTAQFKDYWGIAGGSMNASFRNDKINTFTDIGLDLYVGKFLSENFLLGAELQLGTEIQQNIQNSKNRNSTSATGLGVFIQYYFKEKERLAFYARPSFSVAKLYNTQDAIGLGSSGDRIDYFRAAIGGGMNFFVNPNIALNVMADFSLIEKLTTPDVTFSDGLKPELSIGLQFFSNDYKPKESTNKGKGFDVLAAESWNIGGDIRFSNRATGSRILSVSPSISYFSLKNLSIGFEFTGTYRLDDSTSRVEITPFMRYHIPMQNSYFFVEGGVGLAANKIPIEVNGEKDFDILTDLIAEGKVGLGFFMSKYTALHGGLRYQYLLPITGEISTANAFFDVGLEIGIQYYFASKILSDERVLD